MNCSELISLIKNYEERVNNYFSYMEKINMTLLNNPIYVMEIKMRIKTDLYLKSKLKELGNTSNGHLIQRLFKDLFIEKEKSR